MTPSAEWQSGWSRLVSQALLIALVLAAGSAFVVSRRLMHDQEARLLSQRSDEEAALLKISFGSVESSLRILGGRGRFQRRGRHATLHREHPADDPRRHGHHRSGASAR